MLTFYSELTVLTHSLYNAFKCLSDILDHLLGFQTWGRNTVCFWQVYWETGTEDLTGGLPELPNWTSEG